MSGLLLAEGTNFQPHLFTQHLLRAGATKARVTNGMEQIETGGTMTQEVYYRLIPVLAAKPGVGRPRASRGPRPALAPTT